MTQNQMTDVERLNSCIKNALKGFKPPESYTVSEWAQKKRKLSAEASAEPGRWKNRRTPYLVEIMDSFTDPKVRHIVFVAASQVGKALDITTPIATPDGWKTMEEISVGDVVYDENAWLCHVTFVTDIMYNRPCYKVIFSDGSSLVTDEEHLWTMKDSTGKFVDITTKQMLNSGSEFYLPEKDSRRVDAILPVPSVPVKCIQVDSPNHLYLAGKDLIPTHNTEAENNMIGYIIDEDPGSILFVHPTVVDAKEFSKLRIAPMLRDTPCLKRKTGGKTQGRSSSSNTLLQKAYPGGILTLCGSGEAHALASKPIRYVFGDERDRWESSAGSEGDPWDLAMARQTTFYNAKAVEVSTPTIKDASNIEAAYKTGTMERWCTECPDCGEYVEIKFADIRYEYDESKVSGKKHFNIKKIYHICPECGCIHDETTIKKQPSKWIASNPDAYKNGCRSFWLNAFVSPWASWESILLKYLQAIGNTKKLQVVYNTAFGELWEDRQGIQDESELMSRREEYDAEIPKGVLVLTCGIDTQDNRLEFEVLGHGHFGETWGIQKGFIMGRPDSQEVWDQLDNVLDHTYQFADGLGIKISMAFMDEGGHFTQEVRLQCGQRQGKHLFAVKGRGGPDIPYVSNPKKVAIMLNNRHTGNCWQYQIGVDSGKQRIMDNLAVQTPGSRYCHFPKRDDYDSNYFKGLLSEHLVYKEGRKHEWMWEKIPGHERNENLDIRNYALAAFRALPINLDEVEARLRERRGEMNTPVPVISLAVEESIKPKKRRRRSVPNTNRVYDSW